MQYFHVNEATHQLKILLHMLTPPPKLLMSKVVKCLETLKCSHNHKNFHKTYHFYQLLALLKAGHFHPCLSLLKEVQMKTIK